MGIKRKVIIKTFTFTPIHHPTPIPTILLPTEGLKLDKWGGGREVTDSQPDTPILHPTPPQSP